jgi:hypothetical protein
VEDAFRRLDKLTPEEALIVAAETMVTTRDIDDTVRVVDKQLGNINERLKGVDCRVSSVIKGGLFFPYVPPEAIITPFYFVRCYGDRSIDPARIKSNQRPKP